MQLRNYKLATTGIIMFLLGSCGEKGTRLREDSFNSAVLDTTSNHGYNELVNPEKRKSLTISEFNTDNAGIVNIDRPSNTTINTFLDTSLLFSIWVSDPDGPHADFVFSKKSFYVVDYDGDGDMPYVLTDKYLKIYYKDFIQEGEIISIDKDTLAIQWKNFDNASKYVQWKN